MPYITISASSSFTAEQKKQLIQGASDALVHAVGAPLASVRVMLHELADGQYLNAGQFNTKAVMFLVEFIEGRTDEQKESLIASLSKVGLEATGVSEDEVRVRIIDFPKQCMGMAGGVSAQKKTN